MNLLLLVLSAILMIAVFSVPLARAVDASHSVSSLPENVVSGNSAFALQLYRELGSSDGNLFFSPYSVSLALGMTYAGAHGNTAAEMKNVLHFRPDQIELPAAFKGLSRELFDTADNTGQKLKIANALVLTGGDVSGEYKRILKSAYEAEIFHGMLGEVNGWVNQKTEGKIEKILDELSANSVCVILNAIYFKGIWESQFEKSSTYEAPFKVSAGKQVKVPLMHQKNDFKILNGQDFQAVNLPYKGKSLSMVILLPKIADGLPTLEKQLTIHSLTGWLAELDKQPAQKIDLYLPRFKLEPEYGLIPPFTNMGMKDAFSPGEADFSGMGWPKGALYISQIKHKAFVEVNEEGTEAAAATAVEMSTKSIRHDPVFRADHPFFFLIRDNQTGTILFTGRLVNPAKTL
jgi:serpin B